MLGTPLLLGNGKRLQEQRLGLLVASLCATKVRLGVILHWGKHVQLVLIQISHPNALKDHDCLLTDQAQR